MPKTGSAKPRPCMDLHLTHGQPDNVPGNSYVVKASGLTPAWHAEHLGIVPGFAPETKQHKVSLTKCKVLRAGTPIVENVFIQQRIQFIQGNIEVSGSLWFCVELLHWSKRSGHNFLCPYPLSGMRGSKVVVPFMARLRNQVNCPIGVRVTPYPAPFPLPR